MKKNVGFNDKVVRIVLAVALAALYFTGTVTGIMGIVLLIVGGILVLTSAVSICPLYLLLKVSSRKAKA